MVMKRLLLILLTLLYFNVQSQNNYFSKKTFSRYEEPNKQKTVGITLTFLGVGFLGCAGSYTNQGPINNMKWVRPTFYTVGGVVTVTGLITFMVSKK